MTLIFRKGYWGWYNIPGDILKQIPGTLGPKIIDRKVFNSFLEAFRKSLNSMEGKDEPGTIQK